MASTTHHSMFEGLFDRRLKPSATFAARLREAGYDAARAQPNYPTEVWAKCLEIARVERWPLLEATEAYRHIGREFTFGYFETFSGRLVVAALTFMTPRSFLRRLASFIRLGRSDHRFGIELTRDLEGEVDIVVHNPSGVPGGFVAGMIDVGFEKLKTPFRLTIDQTTPFDYRLELRWP